MHHGPGVGAWCLSEGISTQQGSLGTWVQAGLARASVEGFPEPAGPSWPPSRTSYVEGHSREACRLLGERGQPSSWLVADLGAASLLMSHKSTRGVSCFFHADSEAVPLEPFG